MTKLIKTIFVFAIIAYPFLYISDLYFYHIFSFDILSAKDWNKVSVFWNKGGIIKTSKDYWFLASIFFNPILFITIWRYFYKKSFIAILSYPIRKYNEMIIKKYGEQSKRIILKNIGTHKSKKEAIEELKPNTEASKKTSQSIREAVREKLTNN